MKAKLLERDVIHAQQSHIEKVAKAAAILEDREEKQNAQKQGKENEPEEKREGEEAPKWSVLLKYKIIKKFQVCNSYYNQKPKRKGRGFV